MLGKRKPLNDLDILCSHHKFLRKEEEDKRINPKQLSDRDYGEILAKKYYDKLYKEYAIIDLSNYKTGKIGMRWRVEKEVIIGKGDTICCEKKCTKTQDLETYEVNFAYIEEDEKKNALVKVKVCETCSQKLNYKRKYKKLASKQSKE